MTCPSLAWFETKTFEVGAQAYACAYEGCDAGTASSEDEHTCNACPRNSIADAPLAHRCVSCNTSTSGLFSLSVGGIGCITCFAPEGSLGNSDLCVATGGQPGRGMEDDFWRVRALFALYSEDRPAVLRGCVSGGKSR